MSFLDNIKSVLQNMTQPKELVSPVPASQTYDNSQHARTQQFWDDADLKDALNAKFTSPVNQQIYRNPKFDGWRKTNPKAFEALAAGTKQASNGNSVLQQILMDISGIETSGGQFMKQLSGGPGRGFYQFEPGQKYIPAGFNPDSATQSAQLAASRLNSGNLSNWGYQGSGWGSVSNSKNTNGSLTDFYTPEELNQYLSPKYQLK